jgi:hypothetical protein
MPFCAASGADANMAMASAAAMDLSMTGVFSKWPADRPSESDGSAAGRQLVRLV